jgi:hypothetical protein
LKRAGQRDWLLACVRVPCLSVHRFSYGKGQLAAGKREPQISEWPPQSTWLSGMCGAGLGEEKTQGIKNRSGFNALKTAFAPVWRGVAAIE